MTVLNGEKILVNFAIGNLVPLEAKEFASPCMWPSFSFSAGGCGAESADQMKIISFPLWST